MIKVSEHRLQTVCLLFITAVLAGVSAYWLRPVLVPLVVAVFVVSGITPILDFIENSIASSRFTAAVIAFLFGALVLNVITASLWGSVTDLAQNARKYEQSYEELRNELKLMFSFDVFKGFESSLEESPDSDSFENDNDRPRLESASDSSSSESQPAAVSNPEATDANNDEQSEGDSSGSSTIESQDGAEDDENQESSGESVGPSQELESQLEPANTPVLRAPTPKESPLVTNEVQTWDHFISSSIKRWFADVSQVFIELISTSVIVLIYVFFLMLGVPTESNRPQVLNEIDHQIRSYLSLKTVISVFTGFIFGFALWFFGIPMALAFGMMACLLNFIPNIGPIIASLLPLPLIILHPGASVLWITFVIVVTSGIQFVSGNVIEPRLMGKSSDLHPIVVLVSLMFWGMLWGIVGMFMAVPITSGIRIALSEFDQTKGIAEVMAGRWPKEIFPTSSTEDGATEATA